MLLRDDQLESLRFPGGLENIKKETEAAAGTLREALNVDLRNDGGFASRGGFTKRASLSLPHSLWADPGFPYALLRAGGDLLALDPALELTVVATGLGEAPCSYVLLNHEVLWTAEGVRTGRLDSMLEVRPLGVDAPPRPAVAAASFGGLDAGRYLIAVSFLDDEGIEGALSEAAELTLSENGAISVTPPPALLVPGSTAFLRIYRSEADGRTLWHALDHAIGGGAATLGAWPLGDEAPTADLAPLPPGQLIRESNGVVWMAQDRWLRHGVPMRPYLSEPAVNFLPMPDRITLLEPLGQGADAGMFVAAGKRTFWYAGPTPSQMRPRMVRAHGAVPGTGRVVDGEAFGVKGEVAVWMGNDGTPCLGLPGGDIRLLGKRAAMTAGMERGAMLLREANGVRQLLATGAGGHAAGFATTETVEVFQYRDGKLIP